ncbi:MAG: ComEA family DNA-binding protein [Acidobacteria bacterium]|nr:ComEA family DNA-binding protein [Acidobacteriota bacterium]
MRIMIAAILVLALGGTALPARQGGQSPTANTGNAATPTTAAQVNVNTATMSQLQTLPGIGPATAQRIMDYREQNGGFTRVEELMNVRGIGEVSFLKLKALVSVTPSQTERAATQSR